MEVAQETLFWGIVDLAVGNFVSPNVIFSNLLFFDWHGNCELMGMPVMMPV